MQFLPSSWATYGVDANGDGFKDPYNPADAIFAAARYLRAAGAATNLRGAVFSYNHSQAYVESVMLRAKLLGGTPSELLGAITGLTEARFPVHAQAHFTDGFPTAAGGRLRAPAQSIARHDDLLRSRRAGDRRAGRPGRADRRLARARPLRLAARRLRQHLHLREARQRRAALSGAQAARRRTPPRAPAAAPTKPAEPRPTGPASAGTQAGAAAAGRRRRGDLGAVARLGSGLQAAAPGSARAAGLAARAAAATRRPRAPAARRSARRRRRGRSGRRPRRRTVVAQRRRACSAPAPTTSTCTTCTRARA